MFTLSRTQGITIRASTVVGFSMLVLLGGLLAAYPLPALALAGGVCLIAVAFLLTHLVRRYNLRTWQVLALTVLCGYCILNYGFENIAFRVGPIPVPLGHVLMFAALGLAVLAFPGRITKVLDEPALLCLLGLFPLTFAHLIFDVPRYGFYAVRDASIFFEGIFVLLGLLWAADGRNTAPLVKCLLLLFLVNLLYGYTYPWGAELLDWSPKSGIFLQVPILGHYHATARYDVVGALFCLWVAGYAVRWPRWILYVLAVAQLFALAIHQVRSTYVEIALYLVLLMLLGETRKWGSLVGTFALGLVVLLVMTPVFARMSGRMGPINLAFLEKQAETSVLLFGKPADKDPIEGSIAGRQDWYQEVMQRLESPRNLLLGVGFGQVLVDFYFTKSTGEAVAVRQPHNSHLTVLARLGVLGLIIWLLFNAFVLKRFLYVFRRRHHFNKPFFDLVLWLFVWYVSANIHSLVQPEFEFSSAAIPYYFMVGFALGLIRWHAQNSLLGRTGASYSEGAAR
jgi:O-antigen ligase